MLSDLIGMAVYSAHRRENGHIVATMFDRLTVIYASGFKTVTAQIDCLSPIARVALADVRAIDANGIMALYNLADQYEANAKADAQAKAAADEIEIARLSAILEGSYPNRIQPAAGLHESARAVRNLRAELKATFPGVAMSVTSGRHGVQVKWSFGPTDATMRKIVRKYECKSFDLRDDSPVFDHSCFGRAVEKVLGRVSYVSLQRQWFDEVTVDTVAEGLATLQGMEWRGADMILINRPIRHEGTAINEATRLLNITDFPNGYKGDILEVRNGNPDYRAWAHISF